MKLSRRRLLIEAGVTGFRPEVLEKAIRLLSLLENLQKHPALEGKLALKTDLRLEALTQTELGERAGLDQAVISRLEHGKHEPRLDTLRRVAAALDMRLPELLSFTA